MTEQTTKPTQTQQAAALPQGMALGDVQTVAAWQAWAEATERANDATRRALALEKALSPFAAIYAKWQTEGKLDQPTADDLARAYETLYHGYYRGGGQ